MTLVFVAATFHDVRWSIVAVSCAFASLVLSRIVSGDFPISFPSLDRERAIEIEQLSEAALASGKLPATPYDDGEQDRRNTHASYVDEAVGYQMERFNRH